MTETPRKEKLVLTTFQLTKSLHIQLKTMCVLTEKGMGEFIRIAIRDKIDSLKNKDVKK